MTSVATRIACLVILACGATVAPAQTRERAALPPDFDATVARLMKEWSVPGVAVAVVRADGEPVIRTYGKRQWNRDLRVTPDTMFGIASVTKLFVATGIAVLVQDGKVAWDDPVIRHLPEFRVRDPWVTQNVTLRDLLSHRSGMASYGDMLEEVPNLSEAEAVKMLANYGQSIPFRSRAEYSSYTYIVLAEVIRKVSGKEWGEFLRERVWQPLGMQNTHAHSDAFVPPQNLLPTGDGWMDSMPTGLDAVRPGVDVAAPHAYWEAFYNGKFSFDSRELQNSTVHYHRTAIDPGQSVFASIGDMAKWARVLVSGGDGKVLRPETLNQMLQLSSVEAPDWPLNVPTAGSKAGVIRDVGYGLGFQISQRDGRALFGHGGGELGFATSFYVDREAKLAVIVVANNLTHTWGSAIGLVQTVFDWHYGSPHTDWPRYFLEIAGEEHAQHTARVQKLWKDVKVPGEVPPDVNKLIGHYVSPLTGPLWIEKHGDGLIARTGPGFEIELNHLARDIWGGPVVGAIRTPMLVTFDINANGNVMGLRLAWASDIELLDADIRYDRQR
jgi:CubicO group peptidase (beta-lactamase class C family)